jgi:hypothetical protein
MRTEYTREQLEEMKSRLQQDLTQIEKEEPSAIPLPPMAEEESREFLSVLIETACQRVLSRAEAFLMGQLLATYKMGIQAKVLGKKEGRYFVVSEADMARIMPKV